MRSSSTPSPVSPLTTWTGTPIATPRYGGQRGLDVVAEVGLGEHDDRLGARVPHCRQIALEAAEIEIAVEAGDEEDDVDVRSEHLLLGREQGGFPGDRRPAWKDRVDDRADPSSWGRITTQSPATGSAAGTRLVVKPSARLRGQLAGLRANDVGAAMLDRDACGRTPSPAYGAKASSKCALQPSASNDGADKRDLLGRRKRGHEMCTARAEELVRRV